MTWLEKLILILVVILLALIASWGVLSGANKIKLNKSEWFCADYKEVRSVQKINISGKEFAIYDSERECVRWDRR